ncbi:hypothetical protein D770_01880 [Flammeovirgaceae bacterium 311]|nr:hypothetical protein D770_01880 [Flammeovirgaceae bacterium 311]
MLTMQDATVTTAVGLGTTAFLAVLFIDRIGNNIPVIELLLTIAGLQWIVGPYIDYQSSTHHFKYFMYVSEAEYMSVVVPAFLIFSISALILLPKVDYETKFQAIKVHVQQVGDKIPWALILIGFIALYVQKSLPPALAFIFFLLSNLRFIGAGYLLFSESKNKWIVLAGVIALTLFSSIQTSMFHDFFLWGILLFSIAALQLRMPFLSKAVLVITGIAVVFIIQSVKEQYRAQIWQGEYDGDKLELFTSLVMDNISGSVGTEETASSEAEISQVNVRLNQGWIISAIINNVPQKEPFAGGETIEEAFYASLLPRFISPTKKEAGGRENFMRFTGLRLAKGTSMGTSVIGEAYANYGAWGSIVFMGLWGLMLAFTFRKVVEISEENPTVLLWLPLIFLQVVKAETELVVVLNHLVKASILIFGIYWLSRKVFKVQI